MKRVTSYALIYVLFSGICIYLAFGKFDLWVLIFLITSIFFLLAIIENNRKVEIKNDKKEENIAGLELFVEHLIRTSDLSNFVRDTVESHWKSRRSIDSYGEFFFRLIGQNGKVCELFFAEIRRITDEQKEIFEKSEKSHSDFNEFSLTLSSLNALLQKIAEARGGFHNSKFVPSVSAVSTIPSRTYEDYPTSFGLG